MIENIKKELEKLADPQQAAVSKRFFKTGQGQYAEGDIFLGIRVPVLRKTADKYHDFPLSEIKQLLCSSIHEYRFFALVLLVNRFSSFRDSDRNKIADFYMENKNYVNNWDLVDMSAPAILGEYLMERDKEILYRLAVSKSIWDRRIAIISTFYFIKNNYYQETMNISKILLNDGEDLIHKAVGWMLREVGKRDIDIEEKFLKQNYSDMPRTMLRYAIEKFPEDRRLAYLKMPINL